MNLMNVYDFTDEIARRKPEIRLDIGQPDLPIPPRIIDATVDALREGKTRYTSSLGIMELREKIARIHGVSADNVIITVGGKSPITAALYFSKNAVVINPAWANYESTLKFFGKKYSLIETKFEDGWQPDLSSLNRDHDMLVLNYPNNPTGVTLSDEKYKEILDLTRDYGITILADEVYSEIIFEKHKSFASCPNVIYINSFSKTYSMTGYRLGYAISSPQNIERIKKFSQVAYTCPAEPAQWAALTALDYEREISHEISQLYKRRADVALHELTGYDISCVPPRGAIYVFPEITMDSMEFALTLLDRGVSVFPGEAFGNYKNFIRISLVSEKLPEAVKRMASVLGKA
jgi:aspartate aminotransferase